MNLKRNMGGLDRLARLTAGLALLGAGIFGVVPTGWSVPVIAVGALMALTAATGICPGYVPFGIDTRGRQVGTH